MIIIKPSKEQLVLIVTLLIYYAMRAIWMSLEMYYYGNVEPRKVDDVMSVLMLISIYFNSKNIVSNYFK